MKKKLVYLLLATPFLATSFLGTLPAFGMNNNNEDRKKGAGKTQQKKPPVNKPAKKKPIPTKTQSIHMWMDNPHFNWLEFSEDHKSTSINLEKMAKECNTELTAIPSQIYANKTFQSLHDDHLEIARICKNIHNCSQHDDKKLG